MHRGWQVRIVAIIHTEVAGLGLALERKLPYSSPETNIHRGDNSNIIYLTQNIINPYRGSLIRNSLRKETPKQLPCNNEQYQTA